MKVELNTLYSVADVRRLFFPSRSTRWIKDTFCSGKYGGVMRDGGGWLISALAIGEYQKRCAVGAPAELNAASMANLRQFAR